MGSYYSVKVVPNAASNKEEIDKQINNILKEINRQMSTYMASSEISKANLHYDEKPMEVSPWFAQVLTYSLDLAKKTEGAFDPTVGPLVNLWGFGPDKKQKVPSEQELQKVKGYVGFDKLSLRPAQGEKWFLSKTDKRVYLDLSATAKGFAVDKISEYLSLNGMIHHFVDVGGEIRARGMKSKKASWMVAVERPDTASIGLVHLRFPLNDMAIATSGSYRNFFEEGGQTYSHTIDAKTGRPVIHGLLSVSVLAETCMEADGLATALMAMGPSKAWQYAIKNNLAVHFIASSGKDLSKNESAEQTNDLKDAINVVSRSTKKFLELTQSGEIDASPAAGEK